MPIQRCTLKSGAKGYKWGEHGKCYKTKAAAEKQMGAIFASGYTGDASSRKKRLVAPTPHAIELKPVHPNQGIAAQYRRKLKKLIAEMDNSIMYWLRAKYRQNMPEIAQDASPANQLQTEMRRLSRRWQSKFNDGADDLARWFAQKTKDYSDGSLDRILRDAGFVVDFKMTDSVQNAFTAMVNENVGLIKSIAEQHLGQIEGMVMRSVASGRDLEYLTKELKKRHAITNRRAELIARDQNNKATAVITRQRQKDLGLTQAIWRHSTAGKHPRPSHVQANGEVYDIDKGMYLDGVWTFPGTEVGCRCISVPVIPGYND